MDNTGANTFEHRLTDILGRLSYRDWAFHVGQDAIALYYLQVIFTAEDTSYRTVVQSERQSWSGRKWRISTHMTDSEIVQTALKAVLTAVEHEAREQFLYRGKAIFGPHLSVDRLHALMNSPESPLEVRS